MAKEKTNGETPKKKKKKSAVTTDKGPGPVKFEESCRSFVIATRKGFVGCYEIAYADEDGQRHKLKGVCPNKPFTITVSQ